MASHDGKFTMHTAKVELPSKMHPFTLIPWGDVHRFARGCDVDRWRQFCRKGAQEVRRDPCLRYIGMGDIDDMLSRKERAAYWSAGLHGGTREELDEYVRGKQKAYMTELAWMRGRCFGLLQGNHYWRYEDGSTTVEELANWLGCPVLGDLAYLFVQLSSGGHYIGVEICAHHGKAGGKLLGTSINQVEDMRTAFPMADAYLMGHDHQRGAWPASRLLPANMRGKPHLRQKRQLLCRTGSFLRAYEPNQTSYLIHRIARPADLGIIRLEFRMRQAGNGRNRQGRQLVLDPHAHI